MSDQNGGVRRWNPGQQQQPAPVRQPPQQGWQGAQRPAQQGQPRQQRPQPQAPQQGGVRNMGQPQPRPPAQAPRPQPQPAAAQRGQHGYERTTAFLNTRFPDTICVNCNQPLEQGTRIKYDFAAKEASCLPCLGLEEKTPEQLQAEREAYQQSQQQTYAEDTVNNAFQASDGQWDQDPNEAPF